MHRIRTPEELAARRVRRQQLQATRLLQEEQSVTPHSRKKRQELRDVMLRPNEQKLADERKPVCNGHETATPKKKLNRRERRERSRQRRILGLPEPQPTPPKPKVFVSRVPKYGEIPPASEGWVSDRPSQDPQFRIAGIRVVIFDDGLAKKYYRMLFCNSEVKLLRELAQRKLKEVRRENREAERKEAKRHKLQVRAMLALLGR